MLTNPQIAIIDFGSSKTPAILEMLESVGTTAEILDWKTFNATHVKQKKAFILSGAPVLLTRADPSPYVEKFHFLKETSLPVLGICFGHQLLGMLFGARVFLGKEVRENETIAIPRPDPLFKGFKSEALFTEDHTEGIVLPDDFILLAGSEYYPVEAMRHKSKPLYGVQFHPEVSGEEGRMLFRNFIGLSGKS